MIRINCPYCGERDHSEFSYGGDATINYPSLDASEKEWTEAIFFRKNIKGFQNISANYLLLLYPQQTAILY